jgi:hypothetical protein
MTVFFFKGSNTNPGNFAGQGTAGMFNCMNNIINILGIRWAACSIPARGQI